MSMRRKTTDAASLFFSLGVSWSGSWGVKGVYLDIKETGLHNNDLVYEKVRAMETWQHKLSDNCRDYTVFLEAK